MSTDIGLGLIWFTGPRPGAFILDDKSPEGRHEPHLGGLLSDHRYLTNLGFDEYKSMQESFPSLTRQALPDNGLVVSLLTLAQELGMPAKDGPIKEHERLQILQVLRHVFATACFRLGLDPLEGTPHQNHFKKRIFKRTTPGIKHVSALPNVAVSDLSPAPHRWISVPGPKLEGVRYRTVTVSRYSLYSALLQQPTPSGQWARGEAGASALQMLECISESTDVLARVRVAGARRKLFPDPETTKDPRRFYTGQELRIINTEGGSFEVLEWWTGPISAPPRLPDTNALSLADGVMLEMMHRSWRENPATGFWLSVGERLSMHHLAHQLHQSGIPVRGYGTGKISICTPTDHEAQAEQDKAILGYQGYGVQLPLTDIASNPCLPSLLSSLTPIQAIALGGVKRLQFIDEAITRGDGTRLDHLLAEADQALKHRCQHSDEKGTQ